jgi:Chromate transporter
MIGTLLELFWSCTKIGLLAFGGGNAAIPLLAAEAVPRWISEQEFGFACPVGGHLKMPLVSGQRRRVLASQRHDLGLMGLDITAVIYSPAHLEGQCSVSPPSGRG